MGQRCGLQPGRASHGQHNYCDSKDDNDGESGDDRLDIQAANFETMTLPTAAFDFAHASLSLPFTAPAGFVTTENSRDISGRVANRGVGDLVVLDGYEIGKGEIAVG